MNPLQSLIVDAWYKALLALSVVFMVLGLTVDLKVVENKTMVVVCIGLMFIGVGEWINHPLQTRMRPGAIITSHNRLPSLLGTLFDVLGFLIFCIGVFPVLKKLAA